MDWEAVKEFFKPTWKNIILTIFFLPIVYLGSFALAAGGGVLTPAGSLLIGFMMAVGYLMQISPILATIVTIFGVVVIPYLLSCFFMFVYHFQDKIHFKILAVVLIILILFVPLQITSSVSIQPKHAIATCEEWCDRNNTAFCSLSLNIKEIGEQTCTELGVACPSMNCSEV